jgi:hypothetical protein
MRLRRRGSKGGMDPRDLVSQVLVVERSLVGCVLALGLLCFVAVICRMDRCPAWGRFGCVAVGRRCWAAEDGNAGTA